MIFKNDANTFRQSLLQNQIIDQATVGGYLAQRYDKRAVMAVSSSEDLSALENLNVITTWKQSDNNSPKSLQSSLSDLHDQLVSLIPHVMFLLLPICQGDVAAAQGDFVGAIKQYARVAKGHLLQADLMTNPPPTFPLPTDYTLAWNPYIGNLPWSWTTGTISPGLWLNGQDYPYLNETCEVPFIKLRLGMVYLAWADHFYRSDNEANIYRARELYKAVIAQYPPRFSPAGGPSQPPAGGPSQPPAGGPSQPPAGGRSLGVVVQPKPSDLGLPELANPLLWPSRNDWVRLIFSISWEWNTAIIAQETIAQIGITQINAGLNYYGYSDRFVPGLRYEVLVTTAKSFASLAKQAENDWISFTNQAETAQLGQIQASLAVNIAAKRVDIESQQVMSANDYLTQAQMQVKHLQYLIAKKSQEISDHNSLCGQLNDFVSGMFSAVSKAPSGLTNYVSSDAASAYSGGEAASSAWAGLGVTGGILAAGILGGITLSGIANQANDRSNDLNDLQNVQLTAANANLDAKLHEQTIAQLQQIVASLQAKTAQEVYQFGLQRMLSAETWSYLAATIREVLKRYLTLATKTAWLAERALSYEQDRDVRVIQFDYFQEGNRNLLGADALQADIAQLEEEHLVGFRETQPIKWTVSLSHEFPLAFGQLLATGSCIFRTSSAPFELAYPGSFAHRIRAVEVAAFVPIGESPRGTLTNSGLSVLLKEEPGQSHILLRDFDALFLSDFTLKDDMVIYALPGEGLFAFEGCGIDTFWELRLSPTANSASLASLTDIMLTFRLNARFSVVRRDQLSATIPTISRSIIFPAKERFPDTFQQFTDGTGNLTFDITPDMLQDGETNRTVTNVAVFFGGTNLPIITGRLSSSAHPAGAKFKTDRGLAHSNLLPSPALNAINPSPSTLDLLATGRPDQQWTVSVLAKTNPHLDLALLSDVWLGIEYSAQPKFPGSG